MEILYKDFYRDIAYNDKEGLYIFTDNIYRTSGDNLIDKECWYAKKFGPFKCYPHITTSCIRGLDNAYPLCIQRTCFSNGTFEGGQWNDSQFEEFKYYLDDDINTIKTNLYKYKYLVFPIKGFFNRPISQISLNRVPKIYNYLLNKLVHLEE